MKCVCYMRAMYLGSCPENLKPEQNKSFTLYANIYQTWAVSDGYIYTKIGYLSNVVFLLVSRRWVCSFLLLEMSNSSWSLNIYILHINILTFNWFNTIGCVHDILDGSVISIGGQEPEELSGRNTVFFFLLYLPTKKKTWSLFVCDWIH